MQTNSTPPPWLDLSPEVLTRTLWHGRWRLLRIITLFAALGIGVSLLMQPEFVSEARIMPEMGGAAGDVLKRLASVAGFSGIDMADNEGMDAIRPDLYPSVLQSTPFILYLIDQLVTVSNGQQMTVGAVLMPNEGIRWWLRTLFSTDETTTRRTPKRPADRLEKLSVRQQQLVDDIGRRISARLDTRSGIITISAKMPDANAAAAVAQLTMDYLTEYVTNYRTEKARLDLRFYSLRLNEARLRYQKAQLTVFRYNDQHRYSVVVMQAATMEKQRIEAELSIAQTVYTELSRQFEQAKLKVQERTPVFKVLEPAQVPLKRVSPKRTIVGLVFAVVGLVLGVLYLLARQADWTGRLRAILEESPG